MINIYIDESGSMTTTYSEKYPYFVIALILPKDRENVKRVYKRFVSKYYEELKALDSNANKMFKNNKFIELKGSAMDYNMKINFIDYFCRNNLFEIYYIKITNKDIKYRLFKNTARAFNFVLKQALESFLKNKNIPYEEYRLHIDERNERTQSLYSLEDYLNIELTMHKPLAEDIGVRYYNSASNYIIQIADVFSNIYYVNCFTGEFENELKFITEEGYIKKIFLYP